MTVHEVEREVGVLAHEGTNAGIVILVEVDDGERAVSDAPEESVGGVVDPASLRQPSTSKSPGAGIVVEELEFSRSVQTRCSRSRGLRAAKMTTAHYFTQL